jgi:cytosine/adenosine deaminase-related metal-dependent hydrolase
MNTQLVHALPPASAAHYAEVRRHTQSFICEPDAMADNAELPWTLTARWVFPVDVPPLERGTVTIAGEHIVAVEAHGVRAADRDLGNAAILPGLVNAHTHLDLCGLRGLVPPSNDFTVWLRGVIRHRRSQSLDNITDAIRAGLSDSQRFGTTLLGDISTGGISRGELIDFPMRSVVFYEMLGLPRERARQAWRQAVPWMKWARSTGDQRDGLSPHAPYSVHAQLLRRVASRARIPRVSPLPGLQDRPLAVAIHLAETNAELELLERHQGPFVDFLSELGVWEPEGLSAGPNEVLGLFTGVPQVLFIHGNYLTPDAPIPAGGTIVYCPRTHAAFGHPLHPFREFLARGVRVALGTDSLASSPDLDLLAEARFVHAKHPDVPGDVVLRMATLSGAEALGWADETGSLTPGKSADLVVLPLPDEDRAEPHSLVLHSSLSVQAVLFRGSWVHGSVG